MKLEKITAKSLTESAVKGLTTSLRDEIFALVVVGVGAVVYNKFVDYHNGKEGGEA